MQVGSMACMRCNSICGSCGGNIDAMYVCG
jgi:hypothetical protein